jgi:NAD(P)-dependent dehydrogenase (short-subunit alcohol dehydrogenase family)
LRMCEHYNSHLSLPMSASTSSSSSSTKKRKASNGTPQPHGILSQFSLEGRLALVTGGYGTLGLHMVRALLEAGATVIILGRSEIKCKQAVSNLKSEGLALCSYLVADVTERPELASACELFETNGLDILVNAAGGNSAGSTVMPEQSFFDMDELAFKQNVDLNLMGTVLPCQIFGSKLNKDRGVIINITSLAALKPLTRVVAYSSAKAAVDNFTKWLATEMAQKVSPKIRCNAIAPGFFIAEQNRTLLTNEDGSLTARGQTIMKASPMGRFGDPSELGGPLVWLCSDAASFVTGTTIAVDGGFSGWCAV